MIAQSVENKTQKNNKNKQTNKHKKDKMEIKF